MARKSDEGGPDAALHNHSNGENMLQIVPEIIRKTDTGYKRASDIDDGPQWFADVCQRMRKSGKVTEIAILSPSRAAALLNANPDNRSLSDVTADTYAADIANGRWVFNGEPIIIASTGELNDGQHRCEAVVRSGKAIEVLIVAGVPRATRTTVDMGKARSAGDFLHMHNIGNANWAATIAGAALAYETDRLLGVSVAKQGTRKGGVAKSNKQLFGHAKPTKQEVLTFARANIDDIERSYQAIDVKKARLVGNVVRVATALCIIGRRSKDWDAATAFVNSIVEGDSLRKGSPAFVARERLLNDVAEGSIGPIRTLEVIVKAWNAHRTGQKLNRIMTAGYVPAVVK